MCVRMILINLIAGIYLCQEESQKLRWCISVWLRVYVSCPPSHDCPACLARGVPLPFDLNIIDSFAAPLDCPCTKHSKVYLNSTSMR